MRKPTNDTSEALRQLHQSLLVRAQHAEAEGDSELADELSRRRQKVIGILAVRWRAQRAREDIARREFPGEQYRHPI